MDVTTMEPLANAILIALRNEQERIVQEEIEKVKAEVERRLRESVARIAFQLHRDIRIECRGDTSLVITLKLDGELR